MSAVSLSDRSRLMSSSSSRLSRTVQLAREFPMKCASLSDDLQSAKLDVSRGVPPKGVNEMTSAV